MKDATAIRQPHDYKNRIRDVRESDNESTKSFTFLGRSISIHPSFARARVWNRHTCGKPSQKTNDIMLVLLSSMPIDYVDDLPVNQEEIRATHRIAPGLQIDESIDRRCSQQFLDTIRPRGPRELQTHRFSTCLPVPDHLRDHIRGGRPKSAAIFVHKSPRAT